MNFSSLELVWAVSPNNNLILSINPADLPPGLRLSETIPFDSVINAQMATQFDAYRQKSSNLLASGIYDGELLKNRNC